MLLSMVMALWLCKTMAHVFKKCILILLELQKKERKRKKKCILKQAGVK